MALTAEQEATVEGIKGPTEKIRRSLQNQFRAQYEQINSFEASGTEKELLEGVGQAGLDQINRLNSGTLFDLDPKTKALLDQIKSTQTDSAKESLNYGLDQAVGSANAGAAGRGLPRGSLRAELQAKLQGPALERFQQQIAGIEANDASNRISIPRGDVGLRSSVMNSPALDALQRARLAKVELQQRMRESQRAAKAKRGGGIGKIAGTLAGGAIGFLAGGPMGAVAGANIGGSAGSGDYIGAIQGGVNAYGASQVPSSSGVQPPNDYGGSAYA